MFARVTTYELDEARASESIDAFEPAIDRVQRLAEAEKKVIKQFLKRLHVAGALDHGRP